MKKSVNDFICKENLFIPVGVKNFNEKPTEYPPHSFGCNKEKFPALRQNKPNMEKSDKEENISGIVFKGSETAVPFGEEESE